MTQAEAFSTHAEFEALAGALQDFGAWWEESQPLEATPWDQPAAARDYPGWPHLWQAFDAAVPVADPRRWTPTETRLLIATLARDDAEPYRCLSALMARPEAFRILLERLMADPGMAARESDGGPTPWLDAHRTMIFALPGFVQAGYPWATALAERMAMTSNDPGVVFAAIQLLMDEGVPNFAVVLNEAWSAGDATTRQGLREMIQQSGRPVPRYMR